MLSRKMRGEIREMLEALDEGLVCRSFVRRAAMLQDGMAALSAFRSVFQTGLAAERFAYYEEVLEGLLRALQVLQRTDSEEITALSHELLRWLIDEIGKEPVKKEIVFLPYKASMWDSLESIWQAASADEENCNVHVVPIPYATLTPEREVKEWHCEKDIFPSYVPVIDYRDIDLEALHPDVIFIHNPFDGGNFVTSVAVEYYSDRLKMYTDKLVYVPYFVSGNFVGQDSRVFPAIINADHVIVESEAIKAQYEADYPGGSPPAGKFLALGSPKYDKVRTGTKADHPIPSAWQRIIADRKVILYNTSLEPALAHSDKVCAKLEEVFDFFRHQRDIVLWWRPHPLMKDTFDSLRSEIAAAYREIEQRYIEGSWGIYDDSPDVTRAVIWADAYYGDSSSVMWLYRETGKPIMMQDFLCQMDKIRSPRYFAYLAFEGRMVWFLSKDFGAGMRLFSMDLDTNRVTSLGRIPEKTKNGMKNLDSYCVLAKIGGKIIMAPSFSEGGFVVYDCLTHCVKRLDNQPKFWTEGMRSRNKAAFWNVVVYKKSAFFIGNGSGIIVEYNGEKQDYFYHTSWADSFSDIIAQEKLIFDRYGYFLRDQLLYLVTTEAPVVVCIDLNTMEAQVKKIPFDIRITYITYDGNDFWLLSSYDKRIIRWNEGKDTFQIFTLDYGQGTFPFCGCMPIGNMIGVFPWEDDRLVEIDQAGHLVLNQAVRNSGRESQEASSMSSNFVSFFPAHQRGFALHIYSRELIEIDAHAGKFRFHEQDVQPFFVDDTVNQMFREGEVCSLREFLQYNWSRQEYFTANEMAGYRIYKEYV